MVVQDCCYENEFIEPILSIMKAYIETVNGFLFLQKDVKMQPLDDNVCASSRLRAPFSFTFMSPFCVMVTAAITTTLVLMEGASSAETRLLQLIVTLRLTT